MSQYYLFTGLQTPCQMIEGMTYIENFLNEEDERRYVECLDQFQWNSELKRRVQHFGYKYHYSSKFISLDSRTTEFPPPFKKLSRKLGTFVKSSFDQLIVNEYFPGQGISGHIDCVPCFEDKIVILSLLSGCTMNFTRGGEKKSIYLAPKSLLVLKGEARYDWKHSISPIKFDVINNVKIQRKRRVSLTFRKVILAQG